MYKIFNKTNKLSKKFKMNFLTIILLELRRRVRNWRSVVFTFIFPIFFFFFFVYPLKGSQEGSINAGTYTLVGISAYAAATAASGVGGTIALERSQGWSRTLAITPISSLSYVLIKVFSGIFLAVISVSVINLLAIITKIPFQAHSLLASDLIIITCSGVFSAFGIFCGYLFGPDTVQQIISIVVSLFAMVGGLLLPISYWPEAIQDISKWTPAFGIGDVARAPLGGDWNISSIFSVLVWFFIFSFAATMVLKKDTKRV